MDYLNRTDDLEEVKDTYYVIIKDMISDKIDKHYQKFHCSPRYLLVGEQKLWEVAKILFYIMDTYHHENTYEHYAQIYKELCRSTDNTLLGLKIILVGNDLNFLEVA